MSISFNSTSYEMQTKVICGFNSLQALPNELSKYNPQKILVVTDEYIKLTDFFQKVIKLLEQNGYNYHVFDRVLPEPPVEIVMEAYEKLMAEGSDLIIAVGGGSTIDTAKVAGIIATNGGKPQDYAGFDKFSNPPLPLIAIPTTAGTASEVTGHAAISDPKNNLKFTIVHMELNRAKVAILDPESLKSCPPKVIADAGMDAFTHAFESYISLGASPQTEALAIYAIELISRNIRQLFANPGNLYAANNMIAGSSIAGMAFASSGCGNVHCIARFVGPRFHLSHGLSNSVLLPYVAAFNLPACPEKYVRVAQAMGENTQGLSEYEAAEKAVQAIKKLCHDVGIPTSLKEYSCSSNDVELLAEDSWKAYLSRYVFVNPRKTRKEDFLKIIKEACL